MLMWVTAAASLWGWGQEKGPALLCLSVHICGMKIRTPTPLRLTTVFPQK